jgi:hypothetical protein
VLIGELPLPKGWVGHGDSGEGREDEGELHVEG